MLGSGSSHGVPCCCTFSFHLLLQGARIHESILRYKRPPTVNKPRTMTMTYTFKKLRNRYPYDGSKRTPKISTRMISVSQCKNVPAIGACSAWFLTNSLVMRSWVFLRLDAHRASRVSLLFASHSEKGKTPSLPISCLTRVLVKHSEIMLPRRKKPRRALMPCTVACELFSPATRSKNSTAMFMLAGTMPWYGTTQR